MKRKVGFLAFVFMSFMLIGFNLSVKCDDYELEIIDFYSCDQLGSFQDVFEIASKIYFNLTIRNLTSDPKNVSIWITVYDDGGVSIGIEFFNTIILPYIYECYLVDIAIPQWAYVGNGIAYALILEGTIPIVPEKDTNFIIVMGNPPFIDTPYQEPEPDNVMSNQEVRVSVNATDAESGVRQVILNYTNGNGTWIDVDMTNLEGNVWNATIRAFSYCTNVTYVIIAEDNAHNTITTEEMGYEYQYHVIPEFPSFIILPLFMIATLLAVIIYRRKHTMEC